MGETKLRLYNTLTRQKEDFVPIDPQNVRMYVCGPTVYDFAHIGNARPVIVFDVLFRLLRHLYGAEHVTYVRNITDVDDKINARARRDYPDLPLNEAIRKVTEKTAQQFFADVKALGTLEPTHQPRATDFVLPRPDGKQDMTTLIQKLLDDHHAYVAKGSEGREVLFRVGSMPDYGKLSGRNLDENLAGARIAVDGHKRNPADFVLWKESAPTAPGWDASFAENGATTTIFGRPGWHIECSAMSEAYLGQVFDIHGGGLDLIFPHHENEIAQSRCAHGTHTMANYWMHNGFLQVEGQKMSKSLGNFITINELLETDKFGGRKWPGEVLRLAMLMTHYREPIDFTVKRLEEAERLLQRLAEVSSDRTERLIDKALAERLDERLQDDLDTPGFIGILSQVAGSSRVSTREVYTVYKYLKIVGISSPRSKISRISGKAANLLKEIRKLSPEQFEAISKSVSRPTYKSGKLRPEYELYAALKALGKLADSALASQRMPTLRRLLRTEVTNVPAGVRKSAQLLSFIEFMNSEQAGKLRIEAAIADRLAAFEARDFAKADKIRADLLAQGVQLMDSKDETGKRVTKWELKR